MPRHSTPVRVMFVVPCFGYGGLERVVLSLMARMNRDRYALSFCTLLAPEPELYREAERLGIPCYILDKGAGVNVALPVRLGRVFRRERVDIVSAHDIGATLYGATAAPLAGIRTVIHTDHSQILTKRKYLAAYRFVLQRLVAASIAVSSALAEYLVQRMGVRPERIVTVPNGIDVARFAAPGDTARLRRELGIGDADPVIGTIGRLTKQKGIEHLLRAHARLVERVPRSRLVIVGEGELRGSLEELCAELGIADRVLFTGVRRDVPELLHLFDVFALASLWEGQPITIVEALAAATPVVATDTGGNGEILGGGAFGALVPPGDETALERAIEEMLADRAAAKRRASEAQAYARRELGEDRMARRYEAVFDAVRAGSSPRSAVEPARNG